MDELTLEKEVTKLERYLIKQGREDFVQAMRAAEEDRLNSKLLSLAKHRQEIKSTKAEDLELLRASELKKELEAPYKEQLRMNEKLASFVALVMKEKGLE